MAIALTSIAGLLTKSYTGWGRQWVNDYGGDILYEVFWCLALFSLFSHRERIFSICLGVFLVTCSLEFLQLWHPPVLQAWRLPQRGSAERSHIIGKLLLGTTFSWWDFPHYLLGCVLGWLSLQGFVRWTRHRQIGS